MLSPGDVISYLEMCAPFGVNLQRGMNYRIRDGESLILMSQRSGAPYEDKVEQGGRVIIYEGHDLPRTLGAPNPKSVDQPEFQPNSKPTQNGLFAAAAKRFKDADANPERVRVFEKIRNGIWVYNGLFELIDAWQETSGLRRVFKFKLQVVDALPLSDQPCRAPIDHDRVIPTQVKVGGLEERPRPLCDMWQFGKSAFRSPDSLFLGRFVKSRWEYPAIVREA